VTTNIRIGVYTFTMELFTRVDIPCADFKIDYSSNLMFIGSCFADNISRRFTERKFHTLVNPFGTIYNPLSIANLFNRIADSKREPYSKSDVFFDGEKWNCFDAHGSLSVAGSNMAGCEECVGNLNSAIANAHCFLQKADVVFITLGTAFVYFLNSNGKVVSNCHKQSASIFNRRLITVDEAAKAIENILKSIDSVISQGSDSRNVQVVFTVSPLRHLSDGAHCNNLSKATLQLAIEQVIQKHDNVRASYFPSYEIVMDELRDYRFYAEDMSHLSPTAEDYIFERMLGTYCENSTIANVRRVEKFMKTVNHKITGSNKERIAAMATQNVAQAETLEKQIAGLDLTKEKEYFKALVF